MREKLFLLASVVFLSGSADHALFVTPSITEAAPAASNLQFFAASLHSNGKHSVAPQRRVLVQLAREKEARQEQPVVQTHYRQRTTNVQRSTFNVTNFLPRSRFAPRTRPKPAPAPIPDPIHPAIDKPNIAIHHRLLADEVVKLVPKHCQQSLRRFYVKPIGGRALGGKSTIIINSELFQENTYDLNQEFRALVVHELGHVVDLGCFRGTPESGTTVYVDGNDMMYANDPSIEFYQISWLSSHSQRRGTNKDDFVSGYASWDMFEDFAESFAYYVLHRSEFEKRAETNSVIAAKLNWLQTYLPNLQAPAISKHAWDGNIAWDITKLDYTWTGIGQIAQR